MILLIVIDANIDRGAALENYLTRTGTYRVITSGSPEVTLSRDISGSLAIVITVQDEEQNGTLFVKNLREQKIDLPAIILAKTYDTNAFRIAVTNNAEYMIMSDDADLWHPLLLRLVEKIVANRRMQDKVAFLNKKLNLVGSVTRHDVLNQLTAVSGYTELLEMIVEDSQMRSYIEKERFALNKIRRQFQFAKDYQNIGIDPPVWQTIASVIRRAGDIISLKEITITDSSQNESVLADPALEKAVAQLLDNSVRHGQTVSSINISIHEEQGSAVLVIEDNGTGVPVADKERIFERGFGKYTGWGLFLVKEILAITGMGITETGKPGNGVRFEITIPQEAYQKGEVNKPAKAT